MSLAVLAFAFLAAAQAGETDSPVTMEASPVSVIHIETDRTKHEVIRREIILTKPGESFSEERWAKDIQRLKDTGVFWSVESTSVTRADGEHLYVTIKDKWTLIPRLRFQTSADTLEYQVGLYEANLLGYYTEVGAQLEQKAGAYGYLLWHYNWRLRNTDYYYKLEAGQRRLFHPVYDQDAPGEALLGYYDSNKISGMVEIGTRIDEEGQNLLGLVFQPGYHRFELSTASELHRAANADTRFRVPSSRSQTLFGTHLAWGRPNEDDYLFQGWGIDATLLAGLDSSKRDVFTRATFEYKWLAIPFERHNMGFRIFAGRTGSGAIEDSFTMGGLNEVRGFPDERFYGQNIWYANAEYRLPLMDNKWVLVQPTAFVDSGKAWNGSPFGEELYNKAAVSVGGGVRMRFKPTFNTSLRIDYAWGLAPFLDSGVSVGIFQFF